MESDTVLGLSDGFGRSIQIQIDHQRYCKLKQSGNLSTRIIEDVIPIKAED